MSTDANNVPRILVVDDNEDAATSLAILLKDAGYRVETAFNGKAAIAVAEVFNPDVCILDINMPGINGYELARRLRAMAPEHPPILATMTANNDGRHLDQAADAGFDLHFTKAGDLRDLFEQLADCFNR